MNLNELIFIYIFKNNLFLTLMDCRYEISVIIQNFFHFSDFSDKANVIFGIDFHNS